MALYNPYLPNYNPNYNLGYQQSQTTQGGLVPVPNEDVARTYPLAHGASVIFRDENLPYIYIKTLGFGQLDLPTFEKYKLLKEDAQDNRDPAESRQTNQLQNYVTKTEFGAIQDELYALRGDVEKLRKELGDE